MMGAVRNGVERGSECEAASRVGVQLAREACRGFSLLMNTTVSIMLSRMSSCDPQLSVNMKYDHVLCSDFSRKSLLILQQKYKLTFGERCVTFEFSFYRASSC